MSNLVADKAARGRKHCPKCDKYPGVRSNTCPNCGYLFVVSEKPKESDSIKIKIKIAKDISVDDETSQDTSSRDKEEVKKISAPGYIQGQDYVLIPAGKCPVSLDGQSINEIRVWMKAVRDVYNQGYLSTEALCYWVRNFYPFFYLKDGKVVADDTGDKIRAIIERLDGSIILEME